MKSTLFLAVGILALTVVTGCRKEFVHNVDSFDGKVAPGMTEFEVIQAIGVPSRIKTDRSVRELVYFDADGDRSFTVGLASNRVTDARWR